MLQLLPNTQHSRYPCHGCGRVWLIHYVNISNYRLYTHPGSLRPFPRFVFRRRNKTQEIPQTDHPWLCSRGALATNYAIIAAPATKLTAFRIKSAGKRV